MTKYFLLSLFVFLALPLLTQSDATQLSEALATVANNEGYNGNVLIAKDGRVIHRASFGNRQLEDGSRLDSATIFRLASVSKQFTALGIALLEEDGLLEFDDPLAKHIPELAFYEDVTLRQLIHHSGGLPYYGDVVLKAKDIERVHDNNSLIEIFAARQPKAIFAAGTTREYSNTGYAMLASVIERVSGQTYAEFLKARVFNPLGMTRTSVPFPKDELDENTAGSYAPDAKTGQMIRLDKGQDPDGAYILANIVGDGMIFSTTDDLFRYAEGMRAGKLLPAAKHVALVTPGPLQGPAEGYAFGQEVKTDEKFGQVVNHNGGWVGYLTYLERHPDRGNAIIFLSNYESDYDNLLRVARQYLAGEPIVVPRSFQPIELPAKALKAFEGDFLLDNEKKTALSFKVKKGQLMMLLADYPPLPLQAHAADGFFLEGNDIDLTFHHDGAGRVTGFDYYQRGREMVGTRVK